MEHNQQFYIHGQWVNPIQPLDFDVIKKRYKDLAKKLHPDINPENAEAEDQLKKVNMAYTILKLAFAAQNYEKL